MSELTPASIKKLKVAELRSELSKLGLDSKGNKPVLVKRLLKAFSADEGEGNSTENTEDSAVTTEDDSQDENAKAEEVEEVEKIEKPAEEAAPVAEEKVEEPMEATTSSDKVEEPMETTTSEPEVQQPAQEESTPANDTESTGDDSKKTTEEAKDETPASDDSKKEEDVSKDRKRGLLETPSQKVVDLPKDVDFDVSVDFSKVEEEPEVELDDALVVLDRYTNDLFVKVSPEATSCGTMKEECFTYMTGGARATWGVTSGKVCYEVKVTELHEVQLPDSEDPKHSVRIGWSQETASLQLGEDEHSYGYDSKAKKCTNSEFSDFGETFGKDDVITCYLDLESEVKKISFSKNGEDLGDAFELPEDLQGKAFFPQVLIKNTECSFNFGSQEEALFAPKEGFTFIQNASDESKVHGTRGPASKSDCEVLMMIGLPASGKTTWVKKYTAENPEKCYNVLGTSVVLDKMKLLGVARKQETGGYSKHMDKAAKCLHRLFEIAPSKKRNFILDQTNVYLTAQNKKMHSFDGFKRKAVVCIPTQDSLKERMEQKKKEGTELPYNAICDMKRNFVLPKIGNLFEEVTYVDQDEEQSKTIVTEYAKEVGPPRSRTSSGGYQPDRKRPRYEDRSRHGGYGGGGGYSGSSPRDNRRFDDRRGGYRSPYQNRQNRGSGSSPQYGRGGSRGGYRDNYRGGRGGYQGSGGSSSYDRNRQGGGNRSYGGNKSYGSGNYSNQHRQQYNYSNNQQTSNYSQQQPQQQSSYSNYSQYYQQPGGYQQYGQQAAQNTSTQQTQGYQQQQQQQQYPNYYTQQGTYQQGYGGSYGY